MERFQIWFKDCGYPAYFGDMIGSVIMEGCSKESVSIKFGCRWPGRLLLAVQDMNEFTNVFDMDWLGEESTYIVGLIGGRSDNAEIKINATSEYQALAKIAARLYMITGTKVVPFIKGKALDIKPDEPLTEKKEVQTETIDTKEVNGMTAKIATPIHRIISEAIRANSDIHIVCTNNSHMHGKVLSFDEEEGTVLLDTGDTEVCILLHNTVSLALAKAKA